MRPPPLRPTTIDARGHLAAQNAPPTVGWLVAEVARLKSALEQVSDVAARGGSAGDCAEVARRALEEDGRSEAGAGW